MKRSRGFGGMAAKKKDPKVPFTYAKMSREGAGKKKGPKKMYSDANVNPDGLPWTEEEKAEQKRRAERAREYQGGEAVKTGRKQVKREELRNKLSRLETRIKDAAEVGAFGRDRKRSEKPPTPFHKCFEGYEIAWRGTSRVLRRGKVKGGEWMGASTAAVAEQSATPPAPTHASDALPACNASRKIRAAQRGVS